MFNMTKENITSILNELALRNKKSTGVMLCVEQRKQNFEDWAQIELCDILRNISNREFYLRVFMEEKVHLPVSGAPAVQEKYLDIVIKEKENIQTAIEIKVIRFGKEGKCPPKKFQKDIQVLRESKELQTCNEKFVFCIVYRVSGSAKEKAWSDCDLPQGLRHGAAERLKPFQLKSLKEEKKVDVWLDLITIDI